MVSQLHRSPGASFSHDKGRTHSSGKVLFSARIIPYRGSWLDFEFDARDILYVRIDRRRKMPATILLKAFGLSTDDVLKMYYPIEEIRVTDGKLMRKLDPDLHTGLRSSIEVFEKGGKDPIVREGTRLNKSLMAKVRAAGVKEIPVKPEELVGRAVLTEIMDSEKGEVLVEKNQRLTLPMLERLLELKPSSFKVIYLDNVAATPIILDTLEAERTTSQKEAWVEIYKRLRPGEMPSVDSAKLLFENLFVNPKRYDLSPVGRLKMNNRFSLDLPLTQRVLTAQTGRGGSGPLSRRIENGQGRRGRHRSFGESPGADGRRVARESDPFGIGANGAQYQGADEPARYGNGIAARLD